ncbi:MAG TPA: 3-hydroxyacyl-ACP dehydratase FabZ [Candidatus Angelobacter sp.]
MSENVNAPAAPVSATETEPKPGPGSKIGPLDILQIQAILPHRYPFLLIDRVLEIDRKQRIVALKNVTFNEPFFAGHFPGNPIMPGVLIVEAMAQAGATLLLTEIPERDSKLVVFTGIEKARFRRPVVPGDQLRIEVEVLAWRSIAGRMGGKVFVDGKLVAEATVSCAVVNRPPNHPGSENPAPDPGQDEDKDKG